MVMTERPSGPLYRWVADDIADKVESGRLQAGDRLPSEHALCDAYGVSQITVRRALRELKHDGIVVSRHGLGWFISEHPQSGSRTGTVSLLVPDRLDALPIGLLQAMMHALGDADLQVVLRTLEGNWDELEDALYVAAAEQHVAALILVQGESSGLSDRFGGLVEQSPLPIILILRDIDGIDVPAVVLDEDICAATITAHLLSLGHRRIAYVGAEPTSVSGDRRYWGYANTLWDHGADVSLEWVITGQPGSSTFVSRLETLFASEDGPTAVFCSHDIYALQVISALTNIGRACPRDVAVVGMGDDNLCSVAPTPITSVRFDLDGLATAVARQVKGLLLEQEVDTVHVGGRVIQRQSCGSTLPVRKG